MLFDNGSQIALARNKLCKLAGFKSRKATYTLSGVGGKHQVYTPSTGGKIWTVILKDNNGVVKTVEAFGVPQVLLEPIGHGPHKALRGRFPHVKPAVFNRLPDKEMDLLIGNTYLGLHPKCAIGGFNCVDCHNNLCCYQSQFSHSHVLIGNTAHKTTLAKRAATVSRLALCQAAVYKVPAKKAKVSAAGVKKSKASTTAVPSSKVPDVGSLPNTEDTAARSVFLKSHTAGVDSDKIPANTGAVSTKVSAVADVKLAELSHSATNKVKEDFTEAAAVSSKVHTTSSADNTEDITDAATVFSKVYMTDTDAIFIKVHSDGTEINEETLLSTAGVEVNNKVPAGIVKSIDPAAGTVVINEDFADTADISIVPVDTGGIVCLIFHDADITTKVHYMDVTCPVVLPNTTN